MLLKTICNRSLNFSKNFILYNSSRFIGIRKNVAKKDTVKISLIGASIGAFVGVGYFYHNSQQNQLQLHVPSETHTSLITDVPKIEPSRKIVIPNDHTGLKLTLYQYQTCPFCCKVRAFLDYYGISYNVVEVNPVLRQSVKWSQYKKVPILLAEMNDGYQQLNDSTMIISALSSYLVNTYKDLHEIAKFYPLIQSMENNTVKSEIMNKYFLMMEGNVDNMESTERIMEVQQWRKWADNVLVHTLSPNVYRTQEEAIQAFKWFSEVGQWETHFSAWERTLVIYVGALAMWLISKKLKKKYNLKDDVRESLYDDCNVWMNEIKKKGTTFMGGSKPDLSDLAVYGILSSIEGCYAFDDLLQHSSIAPWYRAMKEAVSNHEGMKHI